MNKEFIPYEQALALKELGFDEPCFGYFSYEELVIEGRYKNSEHGRSISAPLYQQAFRWFREKYRMVFSYEPIFRKNIPTYTFLIYVETTGERLLIIDSNYNEEAELACLNKLIEITKTK